jgi:glutaredoxin 3
MAVILYSTQSCPYCHMARDYLKELKVEFDNKDVGSDEAAAKEMIDKSQQMGVPVIEVGDTVIVGFDRDAVRKALADAGIIAG